MTTLDPGGDRATALFDTIERLSGVIETMIGATRS